MKTLFLLPEDTLFIELATMRMNLAWFAHSRPECIFEVSQLAQHTKAAFEETSCELIKKINNSIKYAKENNAHLRFVKLDITTLKINGFSDASFVGNRDFT